MSKIPNTDTGYVADRAAALEILDRARETLRSYSSREQAAKELTNLYIKIYEAIRKGQPIEE